MKPIHNLLSHTVIGLGMLAATAAQAQDPAWPAQSITLIVSSAAGGTTDMAARMISDPLSKALGKPVVVDNRPGGSGAIAGSAVKRAKPDGYTLLVQYSGYQVVTPHLMKLPFDPIKDFAPVANLLVAPQVIVVRPDIPVKTLPELVGYARAHPGKLSYASSGNGSLQHVTGEMIRHLTQADITHVPYKGTGPAITDLLGGNVDMTFTTAPPLISHIKTGKLRPLAITGDVALPAVPNVPTTAAIKGFEKLDVSSWFAVYAPAGTPKPVIDRLTSEIGKITQTAEFKSKAEAQGAYAVYMNPKELGDYTAREFQSWGKFVKEAKITGE
ncbi:Bug family tripartite tricarboxylate transporter substrate binding protein [Massilia litorea]|jgi:tripartite-type tricarboxylate transporter receptor subunit TctC|uniref:Tripartite tricarboxylate transporter substrate binding protein n=1 Tax=Massilia litorea TaxID=2769491 RepID=A0A7L9U1R1_9BURK|nr:tripartite tricarboxylate transporter substrate binding protein [Massilia litorea]